MKKLLFVLLIMASVTSFCFAQEEPTGVSKTGKGPAEVQTFIGIIDSVTRRSCAGRVTDPGPGGTGAARGRGISG